MLAFRNMSHRKPKVSAVYQYIFDTEIEDRFSLFNSENGGKD
jgi:hypothetical protein